MTSHSDTKFNEANLAFLKGLTENSLIDKMITATV